MPGRLLNELQYNRPVVGTRGSLYRLAVCALMLVGCLRSTVTVCDNGIVCPADQVCGPAGGCVDPEQLSACEGAADATPCTIPGVGAGLCTGGVCVSSRCGDGIVQAGEACDDRDPEVCTANCAMPTCGDGFVQTGEACDEGAANADDRACTTRCLAAMCGDGFVFAGTEECDDTVLNADSQACTSACLRNTCGDGAVWTGVEPCDDGNTASGDGCRADCRKSEVCGDAALDVGEGCDDGNINPADGCDACIETTWQASAVLGGTTLATTFAIASPDPLAADPAGNLYLGTAESLIYRVDAATKAVTVLAGTGTAEFSGDGGPATTAQLRYPADLAVDGVGSVYIADNGNHRIRKVDQRTGLITTIAGSGASSGATGDGGPALSASVPYPQAVAVSGLGDVYVADYNCRIRRIDGATGVITRIAGTTCGYSGDGASATSAQLSYMDALVLDDAGNLYIADTGNSRVRRVDAGGTITTLLGPGQLQTPLGLTYASGMLWISEFTRSRIQRLELATSALTTIAGTTDVFGFAGDGGPATSAELFGPRTLARCGAGVCVADFKNNRVRRVDDAGTITTVFGSGATSRDEAATTTLIDGKGLAVVGTDVYIAEVGRIRRRDTSGVLRTFAGTGATGDTGDGGLAANATFGGDIYVSADPSGNLYVSDLNNCRIRRIDATTTVITRMAGGNCNGSPSGDGGLAINAQIGSPLSVAVDTSGTIYFAESGSFKVRRIDAVTGVLSTYAGDGTQGSIGDDGLATSARFMDVSAVAIDTAGNLFIADRIDHRIRRVDATSKIITTVAGDGTQGSTGDNGPAVSAKLNGPRDVKVDDQGTLYIADHDNFRVRRVAGGTITTLLGTGNPGFAGDGLLAKDAWIGYPVNLAVRGHAELFVFADFKVRRVDLSTGGVTTVAGQINPDGVGPLTLAQLANPRAFVTTPSFTLFAGGNSGTLQAARSTELEVVAGRYPQSGGDIGTLARFSGSLFGAVGGVAYDAAVNKIYITERARFLAGNVVHAVTPVDVANENTWTIATLAGINTTGDFSNGTSLTTAQFRDPTGLFLDPTTRVLYVADTGNHVIRAIDLQAGSITTVAGMPEQLGFFGDGGTATNALLYQPQAITRCGNGDVFIADTGNHRVRRVSQGTITTVLGDGVAASSGAGTPARTFPVDMPLGLACDSFGNVFVTSSTTVRMLAANDQGVVDGSGPVQTIYGAAPRTSFPAAVSFCLTGISTVDASTVRVTDACAGLWIELKRQPT